MITIKELSLDDDTAIKLMRLIKKNEPEIWDVLKNELDTALNKHIVRFSEERAEVCKQNESWRSCPSWINDCRCLGACTLHLQT